MAMRLIAYVVLMTRSLSGKFIYALLVQGKLGGVGMTLEKGCMQTDRLLKDMTSAQAGREALGFCWLVTPWFLSS